MVIKRFKMTSCTICGDLIKDPICKDCYAKQAEILLEDLEIHYIPKLFINSKLKNILDSKSLENTKCILCNGDITNICHCCFLEFFITILREINLAENLIGKFEYAPLYEEFKDK